MMVTEEAIPILDRSKFDFLWFLAGPLTIPVRYAPRVATEKYPRSIDDNLGFLWRYVLKCELALRGMGVVDPYSSDVADFVHLYGYSEGYQLAVSQCDGVVACLMPYHWEEIPRNEINLAVAIETFKYPFIAYTPEMNLTKRERETMKEVKRFLSIIPSCMRIKSAIDSVARKGIKMPTTTRDLHAKVPETAMVQCPICGNTYKSELVFESGRKRPKDECPSCGKKEIVE